ncbi:MAG: hypothetical protein ACKVZ6_07610 [Kineosporiaceae bacterium]
MTDLRELLDQAAGAEPPPLPMALVRSQADGRRRRRRHCRVAAGLAAAAVIVTSVLAPRVVARHPDPADSHRIPQVTVGSLPSGRYGGQVAGTSFTFTIPPGKPWTATRVTADDLRLTEPDLDFRVELTAWSSVRGYDAEGRLPRQDQPVPADLAQWLQGHPALTVIGPVTRTRLVGQPAHMLRLAMRGSAGQPQVTRESCGTPTGCVTLGKAGHRPVVLYEGSFVILVVADAPGEHRLIAMVIPTDANVDAEQVSLSARPVLASFARSD